MKKKQHAKYYSYIGKFIGEEDIPFVNLEFDLEQNATFVFVAPKFNALPIYSTVVIEHDNNIFHFVITKKAGDNRYSIREYLSAFTDTTFKNDQYFSSHSFFGVNGSIGGKWNFRYFKELFPFITYPNTENKGVIETPDYTRDHRLPLNKNQVVGDIVIPNLKVEFNETILNQLSMTDLILTSGTGQQTRYAFKNSFKIGDEYYYKEVQTETYAPLFNLRTVMNQTLTSANFKYRITSEEVDGFLIPKVTFENSINHDLIDLTNELIFDVQTPAIGDIYSKESHFEDNSVYPDLYKTSKIIDGQATDVYLPSKDLNIAIPQDYYLSASGELKEYPSEQLDPIVPSPITYPDACIRTPIKTLYSQYVYNSNGNQFEKQDIIKENDYTFNFSIPNNSKELNVKKYELGDVANVYYPGIGELKSRITAIQYNEYYTKFTLGSERLDVLKKLNKGNR